MSIQHIYLQRHGESLHNVGLEHGPYAHVPLTPGGRAAVAQLPDKLRAAKFLDKPDIIMCSSFLRTMQTARGGIQQVWNAPCMLEPGLVEWTNFDVRDGQTVNLDYKKQHINEMWDRCDPDYCGDLGETFRAFIARERKLMQTIFSLNVDHIFCVTHGHVICGGCLDLTHQLTIDGDGMRLFHDTVPTNNLDIVHIARNRKTEELAINLYSFADNYAEPQPYPLTKAAKQARDKQLYL